MKSRTSVKPNNKKQPSSQASSTTSDGVQEQLCLTLVSSLLPFSSFQGNTYLGALIGTEPPSEQALWFQAKKLYDQYLSLIRNLINSDQHKFSLAINRNDVNDVVMNLFFYTETFDYCRIPLCYIKNLQVPVDNIIVRNTILQDLKGRISSVCTNINMSESTQNIVKFLFVEHGESHTHAPIIQAMSHLVFTALRDFLFDITKRFKEDTSAAAKIKAIPGDDVFLLVAQYFNTSIKEATPDVLNTLLENCACQLDSFVLHLLRPFMNIYQTIVLPHESHQMLRYLRGLQVHIDALFRSQKWSQLSMHKLGLDNLSQSIQTYLEPLTSEIVLMAYLSPYSMNLLSQQELQVVSGFIGVADAPPENVDDSMEALDKAICYTSRPEECAIYETLALEWRRKGGIRDTAEFWRKNGHKIPFLRALALEKLAFQLSSHDIATETFRRRLGDQFNDSEQEFDAAATIYYVLHILSKLFDLRNPNLAATSGASTRTLLEFFTPIKQEAGTAVSFRYFVH